MDLQEEFNKLDLPKSLAIGLGLLVFYYMGGCYNDGTGIRAQIASEKRSQTENQAALVRVRKALEDQKKFEQEIKDITANMKDFQRYFADDMSSNQLEKRVSQLAEQHELTVNELKPSESKNEFPKYSETSVSFKIEGPFHNIMEFISSLTKMEKAIDFSEMVFKMTETGDYPLVELKTTLVVYTSSFVPDEVKGG